MGNPNFHNNILLVMRAGFGRKRIVVTQGDLIFSGLQVGKHYSKPGWTRMVLWRVRSQSRG
ncbi:hypothetical protein ABE24_22705 [Cytobacillus firmus]|nr:hypothetical protein [Cytobacillus firmus]MBG9655001.1 hypothetical protein [Cytobacillus firmus]MBG9655514.1 hypothetical protein [Cytobacillus firmus]MBG9657528.1 hypothetical protein [Cytobacillus firmus]